MLFEPDTVIDETQLGILFGDELIACLEGVPRIEDEGKEVEPPKITKAPAAK